MISIKPFSHSFRLCNGCLRRSDARDIRYMDDAPANRRIVMLCNDCIGDLYQALKTWAKEESR